MKSPFTGGEVIRQNIEQEFEFRGERFTINYNNYLCVDTDQEFTTKEIDELNLALLHNEYRSRKKIPFPEEIKRIREQYEINQTKMSLILGFGTNTYRQYEKGDIPQLANAKLINIANDPSGFISLLRECNSINEKEKKKYTENARKVIQQRINSNTILLFKNLNPSKWNGFQVPDLERFSAMVNFFAVDSNTFTTKMNKMVFYADFLHYKKFGRSISGLAYHAIQNGPVPHRYGTLYDYCAEVELLNTELITFRNSEGEGTKFHPNENCKTENYLSEDEIQSVRTVKNLLGELKTENIIELSHQEDAWIDNHKSKALIDYSYAFKLKALVEH